MRGMPGRLSLRVRLRGGVVVLRVGQGVRVVGRRDVRGIPVGVRRVVRRGLCRGRVGRSGPVRVPSRVPVRGRFRVRKRRVRRGRLSVLRCGVGGCGSGEGNPGNRCCKGRGDPVEWELHGRTGNNAERARP